jgi:hypothetical protein
LKFSDPANFASLAVASTGSTFNFIVSASALRLKGLGGASASLLSGISGPCVVE